MVQQRCGGATAPRLAADTRRSRGCVGDEHRLMVGRAPHVRELFCEWARPHAEIGWRQASRAQHTARVCGCACVCVLASERERERERERARERRLPVEPGRNQPPNSREWKLLLRLESIYM
jgi:hypothetical protein